MSETLKQEIEAEHEHKFAKAMSLYLESEGSDLDYAKFEETVAVLQELYGKRENVTQ